MSLRQRLRSALAASGLAHIVTSACALASALTLASGTTALPLAEPVRVAELYTVLRLLDAATASPMRYGLIPSLLLLAAAPLLCVIWLRAQLVAAPLSSHARAAARVYPRALAIHALGLTYSALLLALGSLLGLAATKLLAGTHDLRLQQSAAWLLAAPCVVAAFVHAPCVADRAQLELVRGADRLLPALLRGVNAVDARTCGLRAACQLSVVLLALVCLLPRLWLGSEASVALLLASQLSALGQTAVRASWLAWLTERAEQAGRAPGQPIQPEVPADVSPTPESECPAPPATGSTTLTR
jgi:hypothetical protein